MILIKTDQEIAKMQKAADVLVKVKQKVWDAIKVGVTPRELDAIAEKEILAHGCTSNFKGYGGFPNVACISVNDTLIHGIPNDVPLQEGDIISVDMGCIWQGYHSDSAFTKAVGKASKQDLKLMDVAKQAFFAGLNAIKPGARVGDISFAIGQYVASQGMYCPYEFTGHGIGKALHEDPYIPNSGKKGVGPLLKDGMVICLEPMILQKSPQVKILSDKWTVKSVDGLNTAHYEHMILIKDGHGVIMTEGI